MSSYSFNFMLADETLDHMNRINSTITSELADLEHQVEAHLAEWDGAVKDAYWDAKAKWNAAAQQMPVALEAGRNTLYNISDGYGSAEQRWQQIWAQS